VEPKLTLELIGKFKENSKNGIVDIKELGEYLIDQACSFVKTKKDNMTLMVISLKEMFSREK
jgi:hypothetical protein